MSSRRGGDTYPTILILRNGAIGDCIISIPTIAALRQNFPEARITLLGDPFSSGVFQNSPHIDRLIALDRKALHPMVYLDKLLRLRREKPSLLIDMQGGSRSAVQTGLIGGSRRIGFDYRRRRSFVYTDRVPYRMDVHTVVRQGELIKPLGICLPDHPSLHLDVTDEQRADAVALLTSAGLQPGQPYAALHVTVGEGRQHYRLWPPERFAELSDRIQEELGLATVVTTQASDEPLLLQFLAAVRHPVVNAAGRTPLPTLVSILAGASLYAGYNSGPMHIAAAVGTPIAALFDKPEDLVQWYPWTQAPYRLVQAGPPCPGCTHPDCGPDRPWCIRQTSVDELFRAVEGIYHLAAQ